MDQSALDPHFSPHTPGGIDPGDPLVELNSLKVNYPIREGALQRVTGWIPAVDGVDFQIRAGESLGLVGQAGSGKTTIGRVLLRLVRPTAGRVLFEGQDLFSLKGAGLKAAQSSLQMVFQNPYTSLDPRQPVGDSISEGLKIHQVGSPEEQYRRSVEVLRRVGLEEYHGRSYPSEFSGGQRQRIGIARALALRPRFIVWDEPLSALDYSIHTQILDLLVDIKQEYRLTYLFMTKDLTGIDEIADQVVVLVLGKMVERANKTELLSNPLHPYTQALVKAYQATQVRGRKTGSSSRDRLPPLSPAPSGCQFFAHCPVAMEMCSKMEPVFQEITPQHWAACHRAA